MSNVPNPGYADQSTKRLIARVVGMVCMGIAVILIGASIANFFASTNDFTGEGPTKMWMFFLAIPFFLIGAIGLQMGFIGAAARFGAGETMPVLKDSAAYLTDGSGALGVGGTVDAAAPGVATAETGPFCRSCGTRNDADAKFCDSCGQSLA